MVCVFIAAAVGKYREGSCWIGHCCGSEEKTAGGGGFLWWRGAVGKKEREWTVVGGLGDEKERGGGLGNGEGRGPLWVVKRRWGGELGEREGGGLGNGEGRLLWGSGMYCR